MYQVFDSELFGIAASPPLPPLPPLPPVDDDYALQRYRGPGDDIDSVLGFLGLGLPPHVHGGGGGGGQMDGTADDPGGGGWGGCPGDGTAAAAAAAAAGWRKAFGGQLMDSDDYDYVDYSCFSSGVTSPDLDSEFFARAITTTSSMGGSLAGASKLDVASSAAYHPWEFAPISLSSSSTGLLRSHSPHFHLETSSSSSDFPLPDRAFSIDRFEGGRGLREEFDSEAEARVREIARYLASFEVQSWPNNDRQMAAEGVSSAASDSPGASLFSIATSMMGTNIDHVRSSVTTKSDLSSDGGRVFHPGYDDACCGLESTMVNPNEVFPDRIDRSDHQYASRPSHRSQAAAAAAAAAAAGERPSTDRHTQRTSNPSGEKTTKGGGGGGGGVSVLEALLRSNEPIDPNKGSGAAVRLDSNPEQSSTGGLRCGVDHSAVHKTTSTASTSSPEGVLKKLLTARNKDGGGGDSAAAAAAAAAEGLRRSDVNGGGGGGGSEEHGQSFVTRPPVVVGSAESGFVGRIH